MFSNAFFCYSAEDKHHVWLGCRVIQVCAYVYVCKSVFDQKINKTFLKMFIYRILGCAVPPLSSWVTGLMHSCCYGGGWQCVSQEKPRRRGKHEISIENIAHDCTKNINHLNYWRCLCFLVQDLFQKKWSEIACVWFSNVFSRTLLTIWHGSQCFFWTKMSNSILNFISQEERES